MPTTSLLRGAAVTLLLCLATTGCHSGTPALATVHGKVSFRGQPLPGGTIIFAPDYARGCVGELACAEIQPDGTYTLKTGDAAGAVPGWHRVTVCAILPPGQALPGYLYAIPPSLLPQRYRDPELSGLNCEVKAELTNSIDFQLD
ncbi:MAG TPA: hypothetical protein VEL76_41365 [Gemmataceae bacterium]|nr:hypothetical protein [Gemmataceae bacterium]